VRYLLGRFTEELVISRVTSHLVYDVCLENYIALELQMYKALVAWLEKATPLCDSLKQVLLESTGIS
jgi:hypothetical protein